MVRRAGKGAYPREGFAVRGALSSFICAWGCYPLQLRLTVRYHTQGHCSRIDREWPCSPDIKTQAKVCEASLDSLWSTAHTATENERTVRTLDVLRPIVIATDVLPRPGLPRNGASTPRSGATSRREFIGELLHECRLAARHNFPRLRR
jgi:hypothetical protein